jgi:gliding motility associated protien GldN
MGKDVLTLGLPDIEDDELYELFWVFYPSVRNILHKAKVFNPKNISQPISYDHLLNARRFSSVIVREANIYGNRKIADYIRGNALFQLLEADRIKESIRNKEIDMWNY